MPYHLHYRINDFKNLIGNEEMGAAITTKIGLEDQPHCYLFTGESGSGKSTSAIITASLLANKDNIISINASYKNGVQDARDIINTMQIPPWGKKNKVYIFEEVHRATKDYQDVLLDMMEEKLPSYVFLIFTTTNPEKLKTPFKRRCMVYELEKPDARTHLNYLKEILIKENKKVSDKILKLIIKNTDRGIGESLSILETIVDLPEELQLKKLEKITPTLRDVQINELCKALLYASWKDVKIILKEIGTDYEGIRITCLHYMSNFLLSNVTDNKIMNRASCIIDEFSDSWTESGKAGLVNACYILMEGK